MYDDHCRRGARNEFVGATWLVRQVERDAMFAGRPPALTRPSGYTVLRNSKAVILKSDEHDVFGDGRVIIMTAPCGGFQESFDDHSCSACLLRVEFERGIVLKSSMVLDNLLRGRKHPPREGARD